MYVCMYVLTKRYIRYLSIFLKSNYISSDSKLNGHPLVARGRKGPVGVHCPLSNKVHRTCFRVRIQENEGHRNVLQVSMPEINTKI